jgi:hypothetical protein
MQTDKIPLNPPLQKGEVKVLPFSKGELEGIFFAAFDSIKVLLKNRVEKDNPKIQSPDGDGDKKNPPVSRNRLMRKFHLFFFFIVHNLSPCYTPHHYIS